jgi:hypothetical protein
VNEKNSIAQSITKVKAVDRINRNPERSTAAPLVPFPIPHAHAESELQGRLPQRPQIKISQYFAVVPDPSRQPRFPAANFLPTSRTTLNTENEGSSSQMSSSINTLTTGSLKRKAPSADQLMRPSTRKKRTCQKCGLSGCSGSNNRCFCKNPCQDCGLCSCPGRNSQHPTKDCREGWKFHHKKLKL